MRKPGNVKHVPGGDPGTFLAAGLAGHPALHRASSPRSDGTHSQKYSLIVPCTENVPVRALTVEDLCQVAPVPRARRKQRIESCMVGPPQLPGAGRLAPGAAWGRGRRMWSEWIEKSWC